MPETLINLRTWTIFYSNWLYLEGGGGTCGGREGGAILGGGGLGRFNIGGTEAGGGGLTGGGAGRFRFDIFGGGGACFKGGSSSSNASMNCRFFSLIFEQSKGLQDLVPRILFQHFFWICLLFICCYGSLKWSLFLLLNIFIAKNASKTPSFAFSFIKKPHQYSIRNELIKLGQIFKIIN